MTNKRDDTIPDKSNDAEHVPILPPLFVRQEVKINAAYNRLNGIDCHGLAVDLRAFPDSDLADRMISALNAVLDAKASLQEPA